MYCITLESQLKTLFIDISNEKIYLRVGVEMCRE